MSNQDKRRRVMSSNNSGSLPGELMIVRVYYDTHYDYYVNVYSTSNNMTNVSLLKSNNTYGKFTRYTEYSGDYILNGDILTYIVSDTTNKWSAYPSNYYGSIHSMNINTITGEVSDASSGVELLNYNLADNGSRRGICESAYEFGRSPFVKIPRDCSNNLFKSSYNSLIYMNYQEYVDSYNYNDIYKIHQVSFNSSNVSLGTYFDLEYDGRWFIYDNNIPVIIDDDIVRVVTNTTVNGMYFNVDKSIYDLYSYSSFDTTKNNKYVFSAIDRNNSSAGRQLFVGDLEITENSSYISNLISYGPTLSGVYRYFYMNEHIYALSTFYNDHSLYRLNDDGTMDNLGQLNYVSGNQNCHIVSNGKTELFCLVVTDSSNFSIQFTYDFENWWTIELPNDYTSSYYGYYIPIIHYIG